MCVTIPAKPHVAIPAKSRGPAAACWLIVPKMNRGL